MAKDTKDTKGEAGAAGEGIGEWEVSCRQGRSEADYARGKADCEGCYVCPCSAEPYEQGVESDKAGRTMLFA